MVKIDKIIGELNQLDTEQVNPNTRNLDSLSALEIAKKINSEDKTVADVVQKELATIAKTAELFAETIKSGGTVFYVGAGTSGRLGVLDASECPPTFGSDPEKIKGIISGGYDTLVMSKEGVEDNQQAAIDDLRSAKLSSSDMVIGIAASTRTPYTLAALQFAQDEKAKTVFIICNKIPENFDKLNVIKNLDVLIELPVGAEAISGSTRMKSGTAQKMTLNIISTTAMVLLGKIYGNLMVDLQSKSDKLKARSSKILIDVLGVEYEEAESLLEESGGSVKIALVMSVKKCSQEEAIHLLDKADGFINKIEGF